MYQQASNSRKKSIAIKLSLAEPHTLEMPPSLQLVYKYDIWNTRDGLSVMETNSSLKAVSLFLRLCIFLSDNHTN